MPIPEFPYDTVYDKPRYSLVNLKASSIHLVFSTEHRLERDRQTLQTQAITYKHIWPLILVPSVCQKRKTYQGYRAYRQERVIVSEK